MERPEDAAGWAELLKRSWEERAASSSREFFVASHAGWQDPATRRQYAENEVALVLTDLDPATLRSKQLLEIGCGSGRLAELLATRVGGYTGIDISSGMVAAASERCASHASCRFFTSDGLSLPEAACDRRYDLIFAMAVFIHCPRDVIASLVNSAWRVLADGGELRFQVLADPSDPTGIEAPPAASESVREEVETIVHELSDEERQLTEQRYYLGDHFRYEEVEPFFRQLTGGSVSTYRGDIGSIYGRIRRDA